MTLVFTACLAFFTGICFGASGTSDLGVGHAARSGASEASGKAVVQEEDLVRINYTALLEDGSLVYSTREKTVKNPELKKANGHKETRIFGPEEVIAGKQAKIPGVAKALIGMKEGMTKKVTIPPESAFGLPNNEKLKQFPRIKRFPMDIHFSRRIMWPNLMLFRSKARM
jgi:hypothetical protein